MLRSVKSQVLISRYVRNSVTHQYIRFSSSNGSNDLPTQCDIPKKSLSIKQKVKAYAELSKFRLSSLVVVTTGAGFLCAGGPVDTITMAASCFGTMLCAASAGTFNEVIVKNLQ